ncbi:alpha/beta hydrolase [Couchioplanes azureus]|uniref:alpha/beta hydrolase n=1 Tax=Couchioplanes caeruleus TaxID=56438 RepID=UPI0016704A1D|nr:alpha/beta hydrolase [Couchioplanes caeruleus]GGQ49859.1 peptidase [Couchioplanes caeruleus subsp. azureus]
MSLTSRLSVSGVAALMITGALVAPAPAASAAPAPRAAAAASGDVTSPEEAERVDRVPAPAPAWYNCYGVGQCATVTVPLDYDDPAGPTVEIALLRVKARKPQSRIGSLFVNPGGPGGSGTAMAASSSMFLSDGVLDRFDIVGFDPRGIGFSDTVACFPSTRAQSIVMAKMNMLFPYGTPQESTFVKSVQAIGRGCSTTGATLAGAMSTAEVARDMDVLRRAVGDTKLTFLGFSYGTALGQYYANMFPDRVRALALDGVIDPVSWTGTPQTRDQLLDDRLRSADGAYRALTKLLARCDRVGPQGCVFSAGDPAKHFAAIARKLRAKPLVLRFGKSTFKVTYADFVSLVLSSLYTPYAGEMVTEIAASVEALLAAPGKVTGKQRSLASKALLDRLDRLRSPGRDFPYDNSAEAFAGVMCTDARHPADAASWPVLTARADARAPYFGRAWGWGSAACAENTWTVRDEDAYLGPFDRTTAAPVLFVGNYWDPATNYREAVSASRRLPGSRLLSSDNWGHTAYGTSACVTRAVDAYLIEGALPAAGTLCRSSMQPFGRTSGREVETDSISVAAVSAAGETKSLPPVAGLYPASMLPMNGG